MEPIKNDTDAPIRFKRRHRFQDEPDRIIELMPGHALPASHLHTFERLEDAPPSEAALPAE